MLGLLLAPGVAASGCNRIHGMDELSYRSDEPEHAGEQPPEGPSCEIATGTCVTACGDCDDGTTYDIGPDPCVPGDCDEGTFCNSDSGQCEEPTCGAVAAELVPTNVLFVVDRSCSVADDYANSVAHNYENHLKDKIADALSPIDGASFNWGLMLFPDVNAFPDDECPQNKPQLPIGDHTADDVVSALNAGAPQPSSQCVEDSTNISQSVAVVKQLVTDPAPGELRPDYVILITDGEQSSSCGGTAKDAATEAHLHNLWEDEEVKTQMVAAVSAFYLNVAFDRFWTAGGTDDYYSIFDLDKVMAKAPKSCKYTLANKPAPDQELKVFIELYGEVEESGPVGSWSYDAVSNTIEFADSYCSMIGVTGPNDLEVEFVCPVP